MTLETGLALKLSSASHTTVLVSCSELCCVSQSLAMGEGGGNLSAVYGADGFGDLFIWSDTELYYSPNGG